MVTAHFKAEASLGKCSERFQQCAACFANAGFLTKHAESRDGYEISLLGPSAAVKERFGFEYDIILIYSKYKKIDSRTLNAADAFFESSTAKGRVESLIYFVVSEDEKVRSWLSSYLAEK